MSFDCVHYVDTLVSRDDLSGFCVVLTVYDGTYLMVRRKIVTLPRVGTCWHTACGVTGY